MSENINIDVYGLSEISSLLIAENILSIIKKFDNLDLRRLHNIVVTDELDKELTDNTSCFKNFSDSLAYAKVVLVPKCDEFELVIVIRTDFSVNLIEENVNSMNHSKYLNTLHVLHHELCHVHDYNQRIDIFKNNFFKTRNNGKDILLYPQAELCWSEYIANYLSSSSAKKCDMPKEVFDSFYTLLNETKIQIDDQIASFRIDKDTKSLLMFVKANISNLIKSASYVLGYMHGMHKSLDQLDPRLAELLKNSYFNGIWEYLNDVLTNMRASYPCGWKQDMVYENLMYVLDEPSIGLHQRDNQRLLNTLFRLRDTTVCSLDNIKLNCRNAKLT